MFKTLVILGCSLVGLSLLNSTRGEEKKAPRSLTKDVLTIRFSALTSDSLQFALWDDGYCVWRGTERNREGAFGLRCGNVPAETFATVVADVTHAGFFKDKSLQREHVGPDAAYCELTIQSKDASLVMLSWHEPYEANGKVYASETGLSPLGNETRLARLKKEPGDYLFYRFAWLELKSTLLAVRPSESRPCEGKIVVTNDGLVWQE